MTWRVMLLLLLPAVPHAESPPTATTGSARGRCGRWVAVTHSTASVVSRLENHYVPRWYRGANACL